MTPNVDSSERPIVIIGAGVVGVMSALALIKRGRRVTLIESLPGPAELCSRANAGILAIGHATAWAGPSAIGTMLRAFAGREPGLRVSRLDDPKLRYAANVERLVTDLKAQGLAASQATDLQQAVGRADVVSCATLTREPILMGDWLEPGQHVDLIGSFTPEMREADDTAIRRARVFIETEHAKVESGDIRLPLEASVIGESDILGTMTDLCRGDCVARGSDDEITLFKGVGIATEDLSAAILALEMIGAT